MYTFILFSLITLYSAFQYFPRIHPSGRSPQLLMSQSESDQSRPLPSDIYRSKEKLEILETPPGDSPTHSSTHRDEICRISPSARGMNLPSDWYVVGHSSQVPEGQVVPLTRLGLSLAFWRKNGKLTVFEDLCPHRKVKLSIGKVIDNRLQCKFHGIEYNTDGRAEFVPEIQGPAPGLCVNKYTTAEKDGWIWLNYGDSSSEIPETPAEAQGMIYTAVETITWKVHLTRTIEGGLDYLHPHTVHKIFGLMLPPPTVRPEIQYSENEVKWTFGPGSFGLFQYPNRATLVSPGNLITQFGYVPIDDQTTQVVTQLGYLKRGESPQALIQLADRGITDPVVNGILKLWIADLYREDQITLEAQSPADSRDSVDEVHFYSDSMIDWYRRLLKKHSQ